MHGSLAHPRVAYNYSNMWQRLAIFALLLAVFPVRAYSQAQNAQEAPKHTEPSLTTPAIVAQQNAGQKSQDRDNTNVSADVRVISTPEKDFYDKAAVWINLGLCIIGFFGIVIAVSTLKKIERQIRVAEADTQAMVRAERPWIVIDVESPSPNQFNFIATNTGRTPADVKSIWANAIITKRGDTLEIPPEEKTSDSLLSNPPCLIPPTAGQVVFRCNIDQMEKAGVFGRNMTFAQGFVELRFYGRIIYSDVLQPESAIPHETKWLYWQVPIQGALPFQDPMYPKHNTYT